MCARVWLKARVCARVSNWHIEIVVGIRDQNRYRTTVRFGFKNSLSRGDVSRIHKRISFTTNMKIGVIYYETVISVPGNRISIIAFNFSFTCTKIDTVAKRYRSGIKAGLG